MLVIKFYVYFPFCLFYTQMIYYNLYFIGNCIKKKIEFAQSYILLYVIVLLGVHELVIYYHFKFENNVHHLI